MKLLLGSQSPRRKELLGGLGCNFFVVIYILILKQYNKTIQHE